MSENVKKCQKFKWTKKKLDVARELAEGTRTQASIAEDLDVNGNSH